MAAEAWIGLYIAIIEITELLQKIPFGGIWNLEYRKYKVKGIKPTNPYAWEVGTFSLKLVNWSLKETGEWGEKIRYYL